MMPLNFERLKDLRRVTWRLVGINLESTTYNEAADSSVILFKDDVEAFIRSLIRKHERKRPCVLGFQYLNVEFPSVHHAPAPYLEDETNYIPDHSWIGNYPTYDSKNLWGRIYLNSIFRAKEIKRFEYEAQSNGHAASHPCDYGDDDCNCKLINPIPEYIDPYVDSYFREFFEIDLDAEKESFCEKFGGMVGQARYY